MEARLLAGDLYVLDGAVNTGVLVAGHKALLFDCCDTVTPQRLAALGVDRVEMVLCTQHRRPNVAGAYAFAAQGAQVVAPAAERHLFEDVAAYWNDRRNRWHIYHHQPGLQVLARPLPVSRGVREGDAIDWEGYRIEVLDTPGATDGSVSYRVTVGGRCVGFSGDALYGPGQVWDVYSLQKGAGGIRDYHGFLGQRPRLVASLRKLGGCGADVLVPAHGAPIGDPAAATELTVQRLEALWRNYCSVSALNYYFPEVTADTAGDPARMAPAETHSLPDFIRRVAYTSFALISDSGAALVIDCGHDSVVETLQQWLAEGLITSVDGCWVTHYHDDHVDGLDRLYAAFGCPILTDRHLAEIIEHPGRFFLPCISPHAAPVARATEDGDSWTWREFRLTAFHFPGQSYYHSGLLVEGHGHRVFLAGDSGAPTGLDDYCAGNRNWLGAGRGFRRCIEIWRRHTPDLILNQHQELAFSFTARQLDTLEARLTERERLLAGMLPWAQPDFGTDEHWVRTYPFEQEVCPGGEVAVDVQFTNHGHEPVRARVEPALPEGWGWQRERSTGCVCAPARSCGLAQPGCPNPDAAARLWLTIPEGTPAGRYVLPLRIWWGERYLGQYRHAVVVVRPS